LERSVAHATQSGLDGMMPAMYTRRLDLIEKAAASLEDFYK